VHQRVTPPWTPERLAATLKPLLFPSPEVQAAIASPQPLPPRPEWLTEEVSRKHLREVYERFPVRGVGWYDFRVGPLLWEGEVWPSLFRPHPPTPSDAALERYAWWQYEDETYWFYAVPVFEHTWLAAWGAAPFPHRSLQEHFAALRDAFQQMEPEPKAQETVKTHVRVVGVGLTRHGTAKDKEIKQAAAAKPLLLVLSLFSRAVLESRRPMRTPLLSARTNKRLLSWGLGPRRFSCSNRGCCQDTCPRGWRRPDPVADGCWPTAVGEF